MTEQPTGMDQLDPAPSPQHEPLPDPVVRGSMEESVIRDLAALPDELRRSAIAATAVLLARCLDAGGMAPRDAVGCVRELRMAMIQLREWNPAGESGDGTDETRAQVESVHQLYAVQDAEQE
jgi:hypothetical protein